ncbi:nicotinate-nucleotide-dimethylbenzimidazolephosphoribosyltransferase [Corynebacterium resistens DSM 45100]|uniref:Nicotinate-nucleotide-dimethylbenzimidazolephosphoribosyltransferase n=1 Tax=Corynebacterium resistens (strain DSM 45100 / JCM 12819 / GTC 2026 / SICGH 158) TaxID=662755 RepID=F8DZQ8_CORRG|nr:nicotinate-nucleotide--dimethylbenzimidazole phosphoribosyltransferase [Corynebacterium resistens]AEI09106.1 nicotinate-nucleotide-dimethylbenzimidazolephosphoribosyltransferase [Corynebacterium resistens DSM 45100]
MAETVTFPEISAPDQAAANRASQMRGSVPNEDGHNGTEPLSAGSDAVETTAATLPMGSLGELEKAVSWIAACQGQAPARRPRNVSLIVVPGSHGIAESAPEISALPADFTESAVGLLRSGTAPVATACRQAGVSLEVIDATLGFPAAAFDGADAVTSEVMQEQLAAGVAKADALADAGHDLVLVGDVGRGLTTVAATVIGSICGIEPVKIIGRGSGISDEAWRVKVRAIRDAMFRVRDDRAVADRVLYRLGGADLAFSAGLLAQCAVRRTPVIFDGVATAAAALCAEMLAPGASQWWRPASQSSEPASEAALDGLALEPLTNWAIGAGQGLGAVLAYTAVAQAVGLLEGEPTPVEP